MARTLKKTLSIIILAVLILIAYGGWYLFYHTCGGIQGRTCSEGYECYTDVGPEVMDAGGICLSAKSLEPVKYDASYGKTCPLQKRFLKSESADVGCTCPSGYKFRSEIIGYDQCAGPGSECPINAVDCIKIV